nr:restriction endonuclease subunit S [Thalassotalea sp. G20_0]
MVKLGELVDIKGGGTPSKQVEEYWNGDIPWASVKDFKGSLITKTQNYITREGVENSATNIIPAGTLIVPTRMALGKVALTGCDMAINQDVKALLIKDKNQLSTDYLLRFLENSSGFIEAQGQGATVKGIKLEVLLELALPLPPLAEQKRIAAILDKADQLRQKRQQAIVLSDDFLRSVFLDMFGDPVTNPKGWKKRELATICNKVVDCPHSTPKWTESGVIGLRTSNLTKGGWDWADQRFVSEETYRERTKRAELVANDIILSREGTVGIAALVPENVKMCMGQRLVQLRANMEFVLPEFMLFLLLYELEPERISRVMAGSTSKHLNVKDLKKLLIMLPPLKLQEKFVSIFRKKKRLEQAYHFGFKEGQESFSSISQKAFSGKL